MPASASCPEVCRAFEDSVKKCWVACLRAAWPTPLALTRRVPQMMRSLSLSLCLLLPMSALAEDAVPTPSADAPVQQALTPGDGAQPAPAVQEARHCGMHGCGGGKVKWVVM